MSETPKNKRGWRIVRWIFIGVAILATLVAIFYTEEDWRGKRAWENYKHEWEAKGERFDWQAFVPPSVPDEQNFFTAPIFTNMLNGKIVMMPYGNDCGPDSPSFKDLPKDQVGYIGGNGRTRLTDLKAWQTYYRNPTNLHTVIWSIMTNGVMLEQTNYLNHPTDEFPIAPQPQTPAKDVLFALSKFDSAIEELRQASQRPYANVPQNHEGGFNTTYFMALNSYFMVLKRCSQVLQLRISAELANNQSAIALDDMKLWLRLNDSIRNSPFLISHLVRMAILSIAIQPIWEGLAKHEWSDEQLMALDTELANEDFLADYEFTMRAERAFAIVSFENQRRTREMISLNPKADGYITNKLTFMPSAYFYQNELAVAQLQQQWLLQLVNTNSRVISPAALQRAENSVHAELKHYSPYKVQAWLLSPAIGRVVEKFAAIQSSIDLARVACALERYRLAHGEYPETLDALSPQFIAQIPHDIINGQPLHYRLKANDQFVLYSVGWNETDDGGQIALTKNGSVDREKGDWIWQYPKKN